MSTNKTYRVYFKKKKGVGSEEFMEKKPALYFARKIDNGQGVQVFESKERQVWPVFRKRKKVRRL